MSMKSVIRPTEFERKVQKEIQRNIKRCPFCGENLGKVALIKYKALKVCQCKKCGKLILGTQIVW